MLGGLLLTLFSSVFQWQLARKHQKTAVWHGFLIYVVELRGRRLRSFHEMGGNLSKPVKLQGRKVPEKSCLFVTLTIQSRGYWPKAQAPFSQDQKYPVLLLPSLPLTPTVVSYWSDLFRFAGEKQPKPKCFLTLIQLSQLTENPIVPQWRAGVPGCYAPPAAVLS